MQSSIEPTGAALTTSVALTAADSEGYPSSKGHKAQSKPAKGGQTHPEYMGYS